MMPDTRSLIPAALSPKAKGWLRFLWRKATTPDDWSQDGKPHPWWDSYSVPPMLNFARFDLSECNCSPYHGEGLAAEG